MNKPTIRDFMANNVKGWAIKNQNGDEYFIADYDNAIKHFLNALEIYNQSRFRVIVSMNGKDYNIYTVCNSAEKCSKIMKRIKDRVAECYIEIRNDENLEYEK